MVAYGALTIATGSWGDPHDHDDARVWTSSEGDVLEITRFTASDPELEAPAEEVRAYMGGVISAGGGVVVSVDRVTVAAVPAIQTIAEYPGAADRPLYRGLLVLLGQHCYVMVVSVPEGDPLTDGSEGALPRLRGHLAAIVASASIHEPG